MIHFCKMEAQGNDFVIIDNRDLMFPTPDEKTIRRWCDRREGVGCDQLLLLEPHQDADATMRIFNNDGSEAANCGNGARCVADLLMRDRGCDTIDLAITDRIIVAHREGDAIAVNMGEAVITEHNAHHIDVTIGNNHRIYFDATEVFDPTINIEIITGQVDNHLWIDIIERGAGRTPACGSGACAVAAAWWHRHQTTTPLTIVMPGGEVTVSGTSTAIQLSGVVHERFRGYIGGSQGELTGVFHA